MGNIYFTADTHFGHKNIIKYAKRPFNNVEEMDYRIINNWNSVVGKNDTVYHLGDFALCSKTKLDYILNLLNGSICLIRGNHEKSAEACKSRFRWIKDYYELNVRDEDFHKGKQTIVLSHYAFRVWNKSHWGTYHLYGHSHGMLEDDEKMLSFDIGVDCHNFKPLSYQEVKNIMQQKNWTPPFKNR